MSKQLSFFGSAFYYTIGMVLAQGTTFIALLVIGNLMSNADYALVSWYALLASIFGTIIGLQAFYSLNNAKLDYGPARMNEYTSATFGLGILSLLFVMGIMLAFNLITPTGFESAMKFPFEIVALCVLQGFFSFCMMQLSNKYRVLNKPLPFVIWSSLISIIRLVLSILLVMRMTSDKYLGDIYGSFIAFATVGIAAAIVMITQGKKLYDKGMWRYCLQISVPYVFTNLGTLLLGQAARYILLDMGLAGEAGIYSYVYNICLIGTAIWMACNNAWNVWYFDKTDAGKKDDINHLYGKYSAFVTLFSAGLVLLSPDIVRILGGPSKYDGIALAPLLVGGCYFIFLYSFYISYQTYKKKTVYIGIGTVAVAALNIGLNYLLIPTQGMMGAAIATTVSYLVLFIYHYLIVRFVIKGFEIPFKRLLTPAVFMFAAIAVTYLLIDFWPARLIITAIAFVFCIRIFMQSRHIMME